MKVHLIKKQTIMGYMRSHATAKLPFNDWLWKIRYADWDSADDIKNTFNSADLLGKGSSRVVFNIGGNNYRMICKYMFGAHEVHLFVCWIGTHTDYDRLCYKNEQYTINFY